MEDQIISTATFSLMMIVYRFLQFTMRREGKKVHRNISLTLLWELFKKTDLLRMKGTEGYEPIPSVLLMIVGSLVVFIIANREKK